MKEIGWVHYKQLIQMENNHQCPRDSFKLKASKGFMIQWEYCQLSQLVCTYSQLRIGCVSFPRTVSNTVTYNIKEQKILFFVQQNCLWWFFHSGLVACFTSFLHVLSLLSGGRQVFGLRQRFDHFDHGGPAQYGRIVRWALENHPSLGDYMYKI
jgi:hypothetical protein